MLRPIGDFAFEDAVALFAETVRLGAAAGADFVLIETMNDAAETRAAVIAAKENCDLPVFVTNVYDEQARLMTGASPETMAAMLEGLRVDALGANCSLGPVQMLPVIRRLAEASSLPVIACPNAGLPRVEGERTVYDVGPEEFASVMAEMARYAQVTGGCCGTTPEHMARMIAAVEAVPMPEVREKDKTVITSFSQAVAFGGRPVLIGERINPTGKKKLQAALRAGDLSLILSEAAGQEDAGAQVLDVNVGLPDIDEKSMMTRAVEALQGVTALPLQIDTANPEVMAGALRMYCGKALVNSVNGKQESMEAIFPLVARYGGVVICLTLDEDGIPEKAEGRVEIARKIMNTAAKYGISAKDLIIDPLCMAIASDDHAGSETLRAVELITRELGLKTSLGISNISFGLPRRERINAAFLTLALSCGLSAAIVNPYSADLMLAYHGFLALSGKDPNCVEYIARASAVEETKLNMVRAAGKTEETADALVRAIARGLKDAAAETARKELQSRSSMEIINEQVIPALDAVGKDFESGKMYLPQLLMSADAAKAAFEVIRTQLLSSGEAPSTGHKVIMATVRGDIHDIGKNIVKVLMENYGFTVIDLGKDVPPETVLETAQKENVRFVGLSALMTTTVPAMAETIALLKERLPECKVMVGGAVMNENYAKMISADYYAKDALAAVRCAQDFYRE